MHFATPELARDGSGTTSHSAAFQDRILASAMCERYVIPEQTDVDLEFDLNHRWWKFTGSFNVSPQRNVPVIRMHEGESEGVMMRWGLIPAWAEGDAAKGSATHAVATDLEKSNLFKEAWAREQRCILPLAGFYGWQLTHARYRQPFFIRLVNRLVFGFAAIWDRSVTTEDDVIDGCALITVPANALMMEVDNASGGQMPAILHRRDYRTWLTGPAAAAMPLLKTYPQEWMVSHAVSPGINSLKYDDAWLIRPIELPTQH